MSEQLGDKPIQPELRELMNDLAAFLDETFNGDVRGKASKNGFILMVFPFGQPEGEARCNYISNANRKDVIVLFKEQLKRFEGMPEPKAGHA